MPQSPRSNPMRPETSRHSMPLPFEERNSPERPSEEFPTADRTKVGDRYRILHRTRHVRPRLSPGQTAACSRRLSRKKIAVRLPDIQEPDGEKADPRRDYCNSFLTVSEIVRPSACPASCLVATPITLPISEGALAPTCSIMAFSAVSSSSALSWRGMNTSS